MHFKHLNLYKLLFFVKDTSCYFTQYYKANVRPIKVYFLGHDVTRFLTSRSNLTNYTYKFLADIALSLRFSVKEVRSYLCTFRKTKAVTPKVKTISQAVQTQLSDNTDPTVCATFSKRDAEKLSRMMRCKTPVIREYTHSKFHDPVVFDAALKLSVRNILPIRFNETRLSLFMKLRRAGFGSNALQEFRAFLQAEFPDLCTVNSINNLIVDYVLQYGYVHGNALSYSFDGVGSLPFPRVSLNTMFRTFVY